MTPIHVNLVLFLLAVLAFAWIGFSSSRKARGVGDYFHNDDLHKNIVSLTATNISLGTGLVYLVSGAQQNGLLMVLPVLCIGVAYWLLSLFLSRISDVSIRSGKNFLASLDSEITKATGRPSWFATTVSLSLVIVFVLLLAFEIFASAKVISPLLFATSNTSAEITISIMIFSITAMYAVLGGVKAIFGVDIIQVPLICLFLPVFVFTGVGHLNQPGELVTQLGSTFKTNTNVIIGVTIACINAIATQFYSILNWGAVSNVEMSKQKKLLTRVGWATSSILLLFVLVGLLHPGGWQSLGQYYSTLATETTLMAFAVSGILVLGMSSILLTTTDAVVVNCILFFYDNLARGDSKATNQDPSQLRKIRWIGLATFSLCFSVLLVINYYQPDPFYLLLSMAGGITVFAPMIALAGFFAGRPEALRLFSNKVVGTFVGIFLASAIADVLLLSQKSPLVTYVGVSAFALSLLLCCALVVRARSASKKNTL
jgi:Na+/proline symporter